MAEAPAVSGSAAPAWLTRGNSTFAEALQVGKEIREEAANLLPTLPRKDASRYLPSTVSDALSLVHAREDAKKKNAGNKVSKAKQKSGAAALFGPDDRVLGAKQGGGDPSAFWLYVEDFFRDATQEDLHDILPLLAAPENDAAFAIGPPGSGAEVPPPSKKMASPPAPPPPPQPVPTSLFAMGNDGTPTGDGLLGLLERRSSRLVSKLNRGGSDVHSLAGESSQLDSDDFSGALGSGSKTAGGGPATGASARALSLPVTSQGATAATLWDIIPAKRIGQLALQVSELLELMTIPGEKPLGKAQKLAAMEAATGSRPLSGPETSDLIIWLENRATALSQQLHCSIDIDLLGLRRSDDSTAPKKGAATAVATPAVDASQGPADPHPPTSIALPFNGQMHPYTNLVLQSKVPRHVQLSALEAFGIEPVIAGKTPTAEQLAAAAAGGGAGAATPAAPSTGAAGGQGLLDTATTSAADGRDTPAATGGAGGTSSMETETGGAGDAAEDATTGGNNGTGGASGRASARQRGISNYALLAGKKDPQKQAAAAAARKLTKEATAAAIAQAAAAHPVSQAVASCVAAGAGGGGDEEVERKDISIANEWKLAASDPSLLAAAPQDELAAETVALQAELAAVAAANRVSLVAALKGLLADLPNQQAGAAERAAEEAEVTAYYTNIRDEKRKELKQRREAAHREALAAGGAAHGMHSPRPTLGHVIGEEIGADGVHEEEPPFLGPEDLYDVLAQRGEDDEAFCAVCGEGHSEAPNAIIFCDRCDVAVHQMCYDVYEVPEDEWLCWPCKEYEEAQRAAGVPQAQIRPPHALPDERKRLPGGSRDVKCALCPIRCGAFRKTTNGEKWVHPTCALWHPECYMIQAPGPNVVEGIQKIQTKRWQQTCDICRKTGDGAVINCKHAGTCPEKFHVMCARNCGLYLTVRPDGQNRPLYRIYCQSHSKKEQEKDAQAATARLEGEQRAAAAALDRAEKAQQREAAIIALIGREEELQTLRTIRLNMESCRMLADQCRRREKLKRLTATTKLSLQNERMQNPLAALAFLDKIAAMEAEGKGPSEILAAMPALAEAAGVPPMPFMPDVDQDEFDGADAAAAEAGMGAAEAIAGTAGGDTAVPMEIAPEYAAAAATAAAPGAVAVAAAAEAPGSGGRRSTRQAGKRHRDGEEYIVGGSGAAGAASLAGSPAVTAGAGAVEAPASKRSRRNQPAQLHQQQHTPAVAGAGLGDSSAAPSAAVSQAAVTGAVGPQSPRAGATAAAGSGPPRLIDLERTKVMTSAELKEVNSKLPNKLKYVPVESIPGQAAGGPSSAAQAPGGGGGAEGLSRATRAAARAEVAGMSPTTTENTGGRVTRSKDIHKD